MDIFSSLWKNEQSQRLTNEGEYSQIKAGSNFNSNSNWLNWLSLWQHNKSINCRWSMKSCLNKHHTQCALHGWRGCQTVSINRLQLPTTYYLPASPCPFTLPNVSRSYIATHAFLYTLHATSAAVQYSTQISATSQLDRSPYPLPLQPALSQKGGNVMPANHEGIKRTLKH